MFPKSGDPLFRLRSIGICISSTTIAMAAVETPECNPRVRARGLHLKILLLEESRDAGARPFARRQADNARPMGSMPVDRSGDGPAAGGHCWGSIHRIRSEKGGHHFSGTPTRGSTQTEKTFASCLQDLVISYYQMQPIKTIKQTLSYMYTKKSLLLSP